MMARPSMSTHTRSHLQVLHRYMMSSATDGSMEECMVRASERERSLFPGQQFVPFGHLPIPGTPI